VLLLQLSGSKLRKDQVAWTWQIGIPLRQAFDDRY
jgi:hypothetical protein